MTPKPNNNQYALNLGLAGFAGQVGCTYAVEFSTDLSQWQPFATLRTAGSPTLAVDLPVNLSAPRFYRARVR